MQPIRQRTVSEEDKKKQKVKNNKNYLVPKIYIGFLRGITIRHSMSVHRMPPPLQPEVHGKTSEVREDTAGKKIPARLHCVS